MGLTETKAKEQGDVKVGKFPFTANSRASIVGDMALKASGRSLPTKYGEVLGIRIIGTSHVRLSPSR